MPILHVTSQFGHNLVAVLEEKGITQAELARRMGVSRPMVNALKATVHPKRQTLQRIAAATGCRQKDLLAGIPEKGAA